MPYEKVTYVFLSTRAPQPVYAALSGMDRECLSFKPLLLVLLVPPNVVPPCVARWWRLFAVETSARSPRVRARLTEASLLSVQAAVSWAWKSIVLDDIFAVLVVVVVMLNSLISLWHLFR